MIYGDRIRLRALEEKDLPFFVQWLNDPELRQFLFLHMPLSTADEEDWYREQLDKPPEERPLTIEIQSERKGGWKIIGNCGFIKLDWRSRAAELGIQIGEKAAWNQGYGTRAVQLLVEHGFQTLNLHRIWLRVFDFNGRAIQVYRKIGFTEEGRLRQAYYHQGRYHDLLVMGLLRQEWIDREKGAS